MVPGGTKNSDSFNTENNVEGYMHPCSDVSQAFIQLPLDKSNEETFQALSQAFIQSPLDKANEEICMPSMSEGDGNQPRPKWKADVEECKAEQLTNVWRKEWDKQGGRGVIDDRFLRIDEQSKMTYFLMMVAKHNELEPPPMITIGFNLSKKNCAPLEEQPQRKS